MFTIDGLYWPWPCTIERVASVTPSDVSGMMLDRSYFNDVIGTYMSYSVSIAVPLDERDSYSELYEKLTDPVEGHVFMLPYNQGLVEISGRVDGDVSDAWVKMNTGRYWKNVRFSIRANNASKHMSLEDVITRGRTMLPELTTPQEGVTWIWHNNTWNHTVDYRNADVIAY